MRIAAQRQITCLGFSIAFMLSSTLLAADAQSERRWIIGYYGVGGDGTSVAHVVGTIRPDGTHEVYPEFHHPKQKSWTYGPIFSDGRRIILTSYENENRDLVRSGKVITHDWIYDFERQSIEPTLTHNRQAVQLRPYCLISEDRRVVQTGYIGNEERIFVKNLDGTDTSELTREGGGFHYALALSHDQTRLACHVTGGKPDFYNPGMYSINVFDLASGKRTLIGGLKDHLMFGPNWSADDTQLVYLDCHATVDVHHFRADLCVGNSDGSGHRVLTTGQPHWFGTPFGSNQSEWSPDGKTVTFTRLSSDATRDMSTGGSQLCLLNPTTAEIRELTPAVSGQWDYRASWCPDGSVIAFVRVHSGKPRELWIMNSDGSNARRLTDGFEHKGADHLKWFHINATAEMKH